MESEAGAEWGATVAEGESTHTKGGASFRTQTHTRAPTHTHTNAPGCTGLHFTSSKSENLA